MSSTRSKKKQRTRTQRYTSNVFAMFNQAQIQEFKEAFNMIDQNRDGYVDKDDLFEVYTSLGKNPTEDDLDVMINMAPGPINFTMFLTLFGEKLNGTDPEDVLKNAFACFDEKSLGYISEDYLKECLMTMGDRWTEDMVDELFHGAPIQEGRFDYAEFTRTLKHGAREKDEDGAAQQGQGQGQQGQGQQGQDSSAAAAAGSSSAADATAAATTTATTTATTESSAAKPKEGVKSK